MAGQEQEHLKTEKIRDLDLVEYLASLGYHPEYVKKGTDHWYLSPLRNESEASFKVNSNMNRWYDHGLGKGGNLIDFGLLYFRCSFGELMDRIRGNMPDVDSRQIIVNDPSAETLQDHKIIIIGQRPLYSYPLVDYLRQRHVSLPVAMEFCKEISYELNDKRYYGIGFQNDSGGWEIRNPFFKCSSSPKDITTIYSGKSVVNVFEGFMDYLSYRSMYPEQVALTEDYAVLNGASMFERVREKLRGYEEKRLWLDTDTTGRRYTDYALSLGEGFTDQSPLYAGKKDLNDWLCDQRQDQITGSKQRPGLKL